VELRRGFGEVVRVVRRLERQRHEQLMPPLERHFGDQAVGTFRERGDDPQRSRRITPAQLRKKLANVLAVLGRIGGAQVPVSGHADDDRQPAVRL
jgi:hypothetical protein